MNTIHAEVSTPEYYFPCDFPVSRGEDSKIWHLKEIFLDEVRMDDRGSGITIAILDTGVFLHHDFNGKATRGPDFTNDLNKGDLNGHGTHIAGLVHQVAENADIVAVKVLGEFLSGTWPWVVSGIKWCMENEVDIISMSLGGLTDNWAVRDAVIDATNQGILVVAAAGNGGNDKPFYPAAYPQVISVGACDSEGTWPLSNTFDVDVIAPGALIYSMDTEGGYRLMSGTSMACPLVSGAMGLGLKKWSVPSAAVIGLLGRKPSEGTTGKLLDLRRLNIPYDLYLPLTF